MNSFFLLLSHFNDYFSGSFSDVNSGVSRVVFSSDKYWIHDCSFVGLEISGNGGSIYCSRNGALFVCENVLVLSCFSSNSGGAIYFQTDSSGSIVLNRVCGYRCGTNSNTRGQFINVQNSNMINITKTSVAFCSPSTVGYEKETSIYLVQGIIYMANFNLSYSQNYKYSSMNFESSSTKNFIEFSSIVSNCAVNCNQITFYTGTYSLQKSNIVNNTQGPTSNSVIYNYNGATTEFLECVFFQNSNQYLFEAISGVLKITSCWLDSTSSYPGRSPIFYDSRSYSSTHNINHPANAICNGDQPKTNSYNNKQLPSVFVLLSVIIC